MAVFDHSGKVVSGREQAGDNTVSCAATLQNIAFRRAEAADAGALLAVHRDAIMAVDEAFYSRQVKESWAHGLEPSIYIERMHQGEDIEIASDMHGVIGFCGILPGVLRALYVSPCHQREGLGRDLIKRAEARLAASGHAEIALNAVLNAVAFYERFGWHIQNYQEYPSRGGLLMRTANMKKMLPSVAESVLIKVRPHV